MSRLREKKPESRDSFLKLLRDAIEQEMKRKLKRRISVKPTVSGTAKILNIHRDTLYEWMKEFNVKFEELTGEVNSSFKNEPGKFTYLIGEALIGEGNEVAHVDLILGDKAGPVGKAFANGLSQMSVGHTPLLAVIRPNLPPKPHTLLVPKVTVKNLEQAQKIFGVAQAAVAKAIADAVGEGVIPKENVDEWVIICSVFVHPKAKDDRRIYHYNYSATKLALKRALSNYPTIDKILYDKDRAKHPIMGFKVPRLWRPPYIQIALDIPDLKRTKKIISEIPRSDRVILEVGTPLLKKYGVRVLSELREIAKDVFFIADLKTLDVGKVEVDLAYEETADAVVASGLASLATLDKFIYEARRLGIYSIVDMMNVKTPLKKLESLKELPHIVIIHRGIDEETGKIHGFERVQELKQAFKDKHLLVAIAGGIVPETAKEALKMEADILIVGRYVTQSRDVERSVREFLKLTPEMKADVDLFRVHVE